MQILKYRNQEGDMVVTEIPKVTDDMVSGDAVEKEEEKPFMLFGREFSRKQVCAAGAGILCAALLIGGGGYAITHAGWTGKANVPLVSQSKDDEKQDMVLTLEVKADGWDADTSTPIIAHIEDADGEVDFYTAIAANKQVTVRVGKSGTYTVTLIPPVNADGSTYKAASSKVKAGKDDKKTNGTVITLEKVDADKVTKDDLTAIAKDIAEAVKKGDSTLTGDKGAEVVKMFQVNINTNPNADADAVKKETEKAQETAKEDKSDAKVPETSVGKTDNGNSGSGSKGDSSSKKDDGKSDSKPSGNNNGGNSSSGSNSGSTTKKDDTPAHQHNWVAQTKTIHHDAQYKTVHHDAQYKTVHHDAVTKTVNICNQCGQDITGNEAAHFKAAALSGGNCQSCHSETRTVQAAYDEQVKVSDAKDEQVQVSDAWDETVTTGYKCSSCGATK